MNRTIFEDIRSLSGLENEERLDEGLKYFKTSGRIAKFADKLENKVNTKKNMDVSEKKVIKELIKRMRELSKEFKEVEVLFSNKSTPSDAKMIRSKFKRLKLKYIDTLKYANRRNVRLVFLKTSGILVLLFVNIFITIAGVAIYALVRKTKKMNYVKDTLGDNKEALGDDFYAVSKEDELIKSLTKDTKLWGKKIKQAKKYDKVKDIQDDESMKDQEQEES